MGGMRECCAEFGGRVRSGERRSFGARGMRGIEGECEVWGHRWIVRAMRVARFSWYTLKS